jgi:hypothetical protein
MKSILSVALFLLALSVGEAMAEDPIGAVNAFYSVYDSQRAQGGGIPDATVRLRFFPVLSPRLNRQLADAAAAQAHLSAKVKNAVPPVLEGDIFSSLFEGATSWKMGVCKTVAKTASCSVELTYVAPPPPPGRQPQKPTNWNDTVLLVNTQQGWKVDDVVYDAGFAFGNTGRLSEMLATVIASNP